MPQRETFILKLVMTQEDRGRQVSALLRSANSGSALAFSSMEKLIEYLKRWELRAGEPEANPFPDDDPLL